MRYLLNREEISEVLEILDQLYKNPRPALEYSSPFELLVATILSAQCTDNRVNKVTRVLFKDYNSPESISQMTEEDLGSYIKSCGLYKSKSKNIIATSKILVEKYGGKVPESMEELTSLPGVGRKTANVVRANAFGIPSIAVDTHVFRVSNRLGLSHENDVYKTEMRLRKVLPEEKWSDCHHQLIFLGRETCKARKPLCQECSLKDLCLDYKRREEKGGIK